LAELAGRSAVGLLLDVTHLLIAATNLGFDASDALERLPLDRVVEIHLSGVGMQSGLAWDDHARPAPESGFALLDQALDRARPRAITFEYNWATNFPEMLLAEQISRVRERLAEP